MEDDKMDYQRSVPVCNKNRNLLCSFCAFLLFVYSSSLSAGVFAELSKTQLSEIRGKYLSRSSDIKYFGISMNTHWGRPSQPTHNVGVDLGVSFPEETSPTITINRSGSTGMWVDDASALEVNPALQQISGSAQNIQISGNGNVVENKIDLAVVGPESIASTGIVHHTRSRDTTANSIMASSTVNEIETYKSDGVVTQFINAPGSIGYSIVTGSGTVIQQLGANGLGNGSLIQSVSLGGNSHHVVNTIKMAVMLDTHRQLRSAALNFGDHTALLGLR